LFLGHNFSTQLGKQLSSQMAWWVMQLLRGHYKGVKTFKISHFTLSIIIKHSISWWWFSHL